MDEAQAVRGCRRRELAADEVLEAYDGGFGRRRDVNGEVGDGGGEADDYGERWC